jgi:hypothetical protein
MRLLGMLVTAIAVCVLFYSCAVDVTVLTSEGARVVNIHRLVHQASAERWGFGLLIAGVLMVALGKKRERRHIDRPDRTGWEDGDAPRKEARFKGSGDLPPT